MVSEREFTNALDQIAILVEDVGDAVEAEHVEELLTGTVRGEEYTLRGHRCSSDDSLYLVGGHPDLRFMLVVYALSITDYLASQIDHAVAEEVVARTNDGRDGGDTAPVERRAASELLDRAPEQEIATFESYFHAITSSPDCELTIIENRDGVFSAFAVETKIFPYEDSFGISAFHEKVQNVVETGEQGNRLVGRSVYLENSENPDDVDLAFNYGW